MTTFDLKEIMTDRSGCADILEECPSGPKAKYVTHFQNGVMINVCAFIAVTDSAFIKYLTLDEQRVFERALRRSVTIVHKAKVDG